MSSSKRSLESHLALTNLALLSLAAAGGFWVGRARVGLAAAACLALLLIAAAALAAWHSGRPLRMAIRALTSAIASYHDGDFNFALRTPGDDLLGPLLQRHNALGEALREQRADLIQRELVLDTIVQQSPVAILLVDPSERIVFSNVAARGLLGAGRDLRERRLAEVLQHGPARLTEVIGAGQDTLFSLAIGLEEESFHFSQRSFTVRGIPHRLLLLKRVTRELARQEVDTWKKLIRVLSHELNNSLAPIVSLASSGPDIILRGDLSHLAPLFATIAERAEHLHAFIERYAQLARLPRPRPEAVPWSAMLGELMRQYPCRIAGKLPEHPGWFDRGQLEQVLINLLKNAKDAGSPVQEIEVAVRHIASEQRIEVRDRGSGMTEQVLGQALLPFYSTKRHGTGLGLALAREIAEAHGGRILLANRSGGGLCVTVCLPLPAAVPEMA